MAPRNLLDPKTGQLLASSQRCLLFQALDPMGPGRFCREGRTRGPRSGSRTLLPLDFPPEALGVWRKAALRTPGAKQRFGGRADRHAGVLHEVDSPQRQPTGTRVRDDGSKESNMEELHRLGWSLLPNTARH